MLLPRCGPYYRAKCCFTKLLYRLRSRRRRRPRRRRRRRRRTSLVPFPLGDVSMYSIALLGYACIDLCIDCCESHQGRRLAQAHRITVVVALLPKQQQQ